MREMSKEIKALVELGRRSHPNVLSLLGVCLSACKSMCVSDNEGHVLTGMI